MALDGFSSIDVQFDVLKSVAVRLGCHVRVLPMV